jgi:eukaryotic-like serine/threonine-protein kinase
MAASAQPIRPQLLALVQHTFADQFHVERELGRGGDARVFLAYDGTGRKVALKILHPEFLESVAAERFLREIKLVSRLKHPRIAGLLASGERDWFVYLAMEFIDGSTLREALGSGRKLSVADTLRVARDLLDALGHAHQLGIVHRDVKPENVVISPGRGAVLLDFGIARAIVTSSISREITRAGLTVGSSSYMSPEQINGDQKIDGRSDIYSVGCVLFECLAGRPPFVWRKEAVVLQMHLTEPAPDVRTIRPDVPAELAGAIAKALAKRPEERWQSAAEMQDVLARVA